MNAVKNFQDLGKVYLKSKVMPVIQEEKIQMDLFSFLKSIFKTQQLDEDVVFEKCLSQGFDREEVEDELMAMVANDIVKREKIRRGMVVKTKYWLAVNKEEDLEAIDLLINGNKSNSSNASSIGSEVTCSKDKELAFQWIDFAIHKVMSDFKPKALTTVVDEVQEITLFQLAEFTRENIIERFNILYRQRWFKVTTSIGAPSTYTLNNTVHVKITSLELLKLIDESNPETPSKEKTMAKQTKSEIKLLPIELVKEWMEFVIWYVLKRDRKLRMHDISIEVFNLVNFQSESHWNQAKIADKVAMLVKKKYVKSELGGKGSAPFYSLAGFPKPDLYSAFLINVFNEATGANLKLPEPKYSVELSDPPHVPQSQLALVDETKELQCVRRTTLSYSDFSKEVIGYIESKTAKVVKLDTMVALMVVKQFPERDTKLWIPDMVAEGKLINDNGWLKLPAVEVEAAYKDPSKEPLSTDDTVNQAIWKITSDRGWYTVADVAVLLETIEIGGSTPSARMSHLFSAEKWFDREIKPGTKVHSYRLKEGIEFPPKVRSPRTTESNTVIPSVTQSTARSRFKAAMEGGLPELPEGTVIRTLDEIAATPTEENETSSDKVKGADFKLEDLGPMVQASVTPKHNVTAEDIKRQAGIFRTASEGFNLKPNLDTVNKWTEGSPYHTLENFVKDVRDVLGNGPLSYVDLRPLMVARGYTEDYLASNLNTLMYKGLVFSVENGTAYSLVDPLDPAVHMFNPRVMYAANLLQSNFPSVPLIDVKTTVKGVSLTKEQVTELVAEAALLIQSLEHCKLLNVKVELRGNYLSCDELKEIVRALG